MTFDRSELQIFANYCVAAAESMAFTLMRTAHSTFVKETEDFSCTIMSPEGLTFATPKTLGATWYSGLDYAPVIALIDGYEPGDVCMTNDAYSGYVATHTPDVVVWKPVFHEGELICFVGGHIHNTDMGGAVPASLSRTLSEVQQEGVRFPPIKIVKGGELDESVLTFMAANVRAPEQNIGDLKAQLASLATGERKMLEIVQRFGVERFRQGIGALLEYSKEQARKVMRGVPDGEYFFADYADEDAVDGKPMRVALTLRVNDGLLEFDFTGSDPQLASSLNVPTGGRPQHVLPLVGLNYVLYSLNPNMLLNAGMLRIATCVLPPGTVLNPEPPAAVGMRSLTCMVLQVVVFGAFSQALPKLLPACPSSGMSILNVKTMDRRGRSVMASIGPAGGGAGGSASGDGSDASGANSAFLRNTPVEINEAEVPIRVTRYGVVPDSGGPGQFRGGMGTFMEIKVFSPNTMVTARNRDRSHFGAWGVMGGLAGRTSAFTRNPGTPEEEDLGNTDIVLCRPGDVIRLEGGGGGGYGDPLLRDPARVLQDVIRGHVSREVALDAYKVVITGRELDMNLTQRLRAQSAPVSKGHFHFGPDRILHEEKWTRVRYAALTRYLAAAPVAWRFFLKHQAFDMLDARIESGTAPEGAAAVDLIFDELHERFPELRGESEKTGLSATAPAATAAAGLSLSATVDITLDPTP